MSNFLSRYLNWLHLRWPAGVVEKLPRVDEHGQSNVSGLYIVGDLTGIPLLKFSADTGARAVQHIAADEAFQRSRGQEDVLDLAIVGAGVRGVIDKGKLSAVNSACCTGHSKALVKEQISDIRTSRHR